jgi:hypothetical protein
MAPAGEPTEPRASTNTPAYAAPCCDPIRQGATGLSRSATTWWHASPARREGWLGEVENLEVSLAGAWEKLSQHDQIASGWTVTDLDIPTFAEVAERTIAQHG